MKIQPLNTPVLYSFRRCPYAIRARIAILYAGINVQLREVQLKNKPAAMLELSPKGTVPVLQLIDGNVLDESYNILHWALSVADPDDWLMLASPQHQQAALTLVQTNDGEFKTLLDRYKYADRFPEKPALNYRDAACVFIQELENKLQVQDNSYLFGPRICWADIAIFPFIRQFVHVDKEWFYHAPYPGLQSWLDRFLESELFNECMVKYPPWQENDLPTVFAAKKA